jgi:hypothetical protein
VKEYIQNVFGYNNVSISWMSGFKKRNHLCLRKPTAQMIRKNIHTPNQIVALGKRIKSDLHESQLKSYIGWKTSWTYHDVNDFLEDYYPGYYY